MKTRETSVTIGLPPLLTDSLRWKKLAIHRHLLCLAGNRRGRHRQASHRCSLVRRAQGRRFPCCTAVNRAKRDEDSRYHRRSSSIRCNTDHHRRARCLLVTTGRPPRLRSAGREGE
nr:hypothetical protein Itr_chr09CG16700 [Ipomoea trifida]